MELLSFEQTPLSSSCELALLLLVAMPLLLVVMPGATI